MRKKLRRDKNKTMSEQVYEELEGLIVFCKIEPGSILTEKEICEMLGAGRTPVREALRMLASQSLVNISRVGVLIPEISASMQLQLLEVRRAILNLCVGKAIDRLTELDKRALKELLDVKYQDDASFLYWLRKRHLILAKCSKNQFIYEELRNMHGLSHRFWYFYAKKEDYLEIQKLHMNILETILIQDKKSAISAVNNLVDYFEIFTRKNLG